MKKLFLFVLLATIATAQLPYQLHLQQVNAAGDGFRDVDLTVNGSTVIADLNTLRAAIGAGTGTLTDFNFTNANGISGTVGNSTTTPTLSISLGNITPTTVNGLTITPGNGTLTLAAGKTFSVEKTLSFTGQDGTASVVPTTKALGTPAYGNVLPGFFKYLRSYRYDLGTTVDVVGLGSSVGNGAGLVSPSVDSPLAHFVTTLGTYVSKINAVTFAAQNYSIDGSVAVDGVNTGYPNAVGAGHPGKLTLIVYGMNDSGVTSYNAGQTLPGFYTQMTLLVQLIRAAGCEPIICTTVHSHTTKSSWSMPGGTSQSYPTSVAAPVSNTQIYPTVANATTTISWQGVNIPVSRRHTHINEIMRYVAREQGVALIDVERYWFDAVAKYGQDNLYDAPESVHPNLVGYQNSYHVAIDDFVKSLFDYRAVSTVGAALPTGTIVGTTDTQTLTNKTLTAPTIDSVTVPVDPLDFNGPASSASILWRTRFINTSNPAALGYGVGVKFKLSSDSGTEANKWAGIAVIAESNFANATGLGFFTNASSAGGTATQKMYLSGAGNLSLTGNFIGSGTITGTSAFITGLTLTGNATVSGTLGVSGVTTLGDIISASAGVTWGADSGATGISIYGTSGGGNATTVKLKAGGAVIVNVTTGGAAVTGTLSTTSTATMGGVTVLKTYTVATLPAAASSPYGIVFVSDATNAAGTGLGSSPTGSGTVKRMVYSDGTSWLLL